MATPFQATQSFTPTQVPGCQLWFDAADQTTLTYSSGTSVSQWRDKSSNAYSVIQPTTSNQPTVTQFAQNRLPGIQFAQISFLYQAATSMPNFTTGGSTSVLMAARNANNNDSWNIINTIWFDIAGLTATLRYHFSFNQNATDGTTLYTNSSLVGQVTSNAVAPSANAILGFTASATSQTIHTNGSTNSYPGTTLPDATGNTDFVFNDPRNNVASANTMIFEMVGYNTQISVAQRQQLEGYLAWKWDMVANLPADHPYKTTPIISLPPFPNAPRVPSSINTSVFSPTQISGCQLWLDAADTTTVSLSGLNVTQWSDKSGLSNNATATGTITNPVSINGLRAMNYSGAFNTFFLGSVTNTGTTLSAFSVFIMNASSFAAARIVSLAKPGIFDFNNSLYTAPILRRTSQMGAYRNSSDLSVITYGFGTVCVFSSIYNGINNIVYLNGTAGTTVLSSGNFGYTNYLIGGSFGEEGVANLNGVIGEVILYNTALNTSERQQVEGYLAWKWGLTGNLPNGHPYKSPPLAPFSYGIRRATQSSSWSPLNITGSALWLDARSPSSITPSTGGTVTAITDKSSSPKTISVVNTVSYTVNTSLVFTDTNGRLSLGLMPAAPYDYIFVGTANSSSGTWRSMLRTESGSATLPFLLQSGTNNAGMWNGSAFFQFGSLTQAPDERAMFYGSMATNRTITASKNGTVALTSATPAGDGSILAIVGNNTGVSQPYGQIHEIIIYSQTLSLNQRQQVEGYLAWKWGLVASLPLNHPFKFFPPPPS